MGDKVSCSDSNNNNNNDTVHSLTHTHTDESFNLPPIVPYGNAQSWAEAQAETAKAIFNMQKTHAAIAPPVAKAAQCAEASRT